MSRLDSKRSGSDMANGKGGRNLLFVGLIPLLAFVLGLAFGYAKPELGEAFAAGLGMLGIMIAAWLIWRPRFRDERDAERIRLRLGAS
jgi:hypothetical protein